MNKSPRNFKLTLEYDGTAFYGWQIQKRKKTIQGTLQKTLKKITGEKIIVMGSGRTDAGVHALAQVAHFKTRSAYSLQKMQRALNALLPSSIVVKKIEEVFEEFHAQWDAKKKTYTYFIWNDSTPSAFFHPYVWQIKYPLDWKAMEKALQCLVGQHDFKSFQSVGTPVASTVREIFRASIKSVGASANKSWRAPLHSISLEANGFLKQMVRNIVGTVVQVGLGQIKPQEIQKILQAKDRRKAGPAAPAKGLFLLRVEY